jgi:hypothetical protein
MADLLGIANHIDLRVEVLDDIPKVPDGLTILSRLTRVTRLK